MRFCFVLIYIYILFVLDCVLLLKSANLKPHPMYTYIKFYYTILRDVWQLYPIRYYPRSPSISSTTHIPHRPASRSSLLPLTLPLTTMALSEDRCKIYFFEEKLNKRQFLQCFVTLLQVLPHSYQVQLIFFTCRCCSDCVNNNNC